MHMKPLRFAEFFTMLASNLVVFSMVLFTFNLTCAGKVLVLFS